MNLHNTMKMPLLAAAVLGVVLSFEPVATYGADTPPAGAAKPARSREAIVSEYQQLTAQIDAATGPEVLSNPKQLADLAPRAIPAIAHQLQVIDEMVATHLVGADQAHGLKMSPTALLYLMKDPRTVAQVNQDASNGDVDRQLGGQSIALYSRWISADKDQAVKVAEDLEKLDRAHPESAELSRLTATFAATAPSAELSKRFGGLLAEVMTSPVARRILAQQQQQDQGGAARAAMVNKPFSVTGKTVQGVAFSSESLKGKVVMVDFWATWCPQCKAALPHVKDVYSKYHPQGFEIVGVSNDYAAKDVLDFTPQNNMPWTQLYDPLAAAEHRWNSLTEKSGVDSLPGMYLIDKKGILRSVTAAQDMDTVIPKLLAE